MKLNLLWMFPAAALLISCASNAPYRPATPPEKIEFRGARLDVYPEDVRQDPARYADVHVAWAGIIVSNDATDEENSDKIRMDTVFEHHYFDWGQDDQAGGARLLVSPRGEGLFRMRWHMSRKDLDASSADAMKYAKPGHLAIVYGTPESVDADGTIVLRYHYLRMVGPAHFTTHQPAYGRMGEPFHPNAVTNSPSR